MIVRRRNQVQEERTVVHPLRLRLCIGIPMKRKSYTCISDFSWNSPGFFFFFSKENKMLLTRTRH